MSVVPPRFPCGRWLGKGVGDGSLERVLIGQLVSPGGEEDAGRWTGTPPELASPSQSVRTVLGSLGSRSSTYWQSPHSWAQWLTYLFPCSLQQQILLPVSPFCSSPFHTSPPRVSIFNSSWFILSGMLSVEVQEDMREAANNLVKHFHKPEQEVCDQQWACHTDLAPTFT